MTASVTLTRDGLRLADTGETVPLYFGSVQYWRLDPADWPTILRQVRELGFRGIETYVPWSVHEVARGRYDFTGRLDLDAFLDEAHRAGLRVLARPGPHINAELSEFGFPARVIHDPALQARTAGGAPAIHLIPPRAFPIVSYASEEFFAEVAEWFDEVCPRLARRLYPHGPIVMTQADNENSYFFRLAPYDVDYSDAAIGAYHAFLADRYGTVEPLNSAYGTDFASFAEVAPPRRFRARDAADLPPYLDWARAKEAYLTGSLARIAGMLRSRGLDPVPMCHNTPAAYGPPYNQPAIEAIVDVQGIDLYEHVDGYQFIKRNCLYATGTSRFPFLPEFGAGTWPWWRPIDSDDTRHNVLAALMHGIKGFNYYMAVERDRWLGSPIDRTGQLRPYADFYRDLLTLLDRLEWHTYQRRQDVLLLEVREYEQHAFTARLPGPAFGLADASPLDGLAGAYGPLATRYPVRQADLGLGTDIPTTSRRFAEECAAHLTAMHVPYAIGDSASGAGWLSRYPVVIAPGYRYMTRETQQTLAGYVAGGGRLVIGPELPGLDDTMHGCHVLRDVGGTRLHHLRSLEDLPAILTALGMSPPWTLDNPAIDLALHERGQDQVLFLANTTAEPQSSSLKWPQVHAMTPLLDGPTPVSGGAGAFDIALGPHEIQLLAVQSC